LKRQFLRVDPLLLEQECQVVGFIDRKTARGQRIAASMLDFEAMGSGGGGSRARRRGPARVSAGSKPQTLSRGPADAYAEHPASLMSVLAIFP